MVREGQKSNSTWKALVVPVSFEIALTFFDFDIGQFVSCNFCSRVTPFQHNEITVEFICTIVKIGKVRFFFVENRHRTQIHAQRRDKNFPRIYLFYTIVLRTIRCIHMPTIKVISIIEIRYCCTLSRRLHRTRTYFQ